MIKHAWSRRVQNEINDEKHLSIFGSRGASTTISKMLLLSQKVADYLETLLHQ